MRIKRILLFLALSALEGTLAAAQTNRGILEAPDETPPQLTVGKQYLAVIAVSRYWQWTPLASPVKDAQEIRDILLSRYRIDRLYELYDEQATKANILRLLVSLQQEIESDDSLLILYAGHGHLDKSSSSGFWIPVNAGTDVYEQQNWLPHTQLRGLLANVKAMHLFVIADSCFAGDLILATRSLPDQVNRDFLQKAYSHVCRQVLASGAAEAVPDVSDFAYQLKSVLRRNRNPYLDTFTLYNDMRLGVSGSVPLLGSLAGTGHQEGASFLLFLQPGPAQPPEQLEPPGEAWPGVAEVARLRGNHLSGSVGVGAAFPLADSANSLDVAAVLLSSFRYNLLRNWGSLGIGLLMGAISVDSNPSGASSRRINYFPAAAELRFSTRGTRSPSLFVGLAAGAAFSRTRFRDPGLESTSTTAFLLTPSFGVCLLARGRLRIVAGIRWLLTYFEDTPYEGFSPEAGVEYAF